MPRPELAPEVPVTQKREFWVLMGYAVALGVFGAFAGLVFVGVIDFGGKWYADSDSGWFGGHWWGGGHRGGRCRGRAAAPPDAPARADTRPVRRPEKRARRHRTGSGDRRVSAVSLIGGASLGPEKALGAMGGGAGTWLARRRALGNEDSQVNTLVGFTGAYGGLFSSTVIVVMLILEAARPGGQRFFWPSSGGRRIQRLVRDLLRHRRRRVPGCLPSPALQLRDWQLLAGIPLGLFAALLVTLLVAFMRVASRLFGRLKLPGIAKSTLGGVVFGSSAWPCR